MLNPPLSLLSDDLLFYIVEHVAKLPFQNEQLCNLSLADRAFTQFCQTYIFRTLRLGNTISRRLEKVEIFLNNKPTIANRVRTFKLSLLPGQNVWLFNDRSFISILQLFAKSPMPPHKLHLSGPTCYQVIIEDPILVVERLVQSFFAQTLTVLHLTDCENVPLPLFLICPRLRDVLLDRVGVAEESYDKYPDNQCCGRDLPALELFDYRASQRLVEQMITLPPKFHTPVVLWSKLRVLTLSPHEEKDMACLQPILDAACNTLEELYLTRLRVGICEQLSLSGIVNLVHLSCLRVFALHAIVRCDAQGSGVLRDINIVLGTIPTANKVTNLSFAFTIVGNNPYDGCLDQDWAGMCDEVVRISAGKPLELELQTTVYMGNEPQHSGQDELYKCIREKTVSLSDYPKICAHFWNPTCWTHGQIGLFHPRNQVRSRCRR